MTYDAVLSSIIVFLRHIFQICKKIEMTAAAHTPHYVLCPHEAWMCVAVFSYLLLFCVSCFVYAVSCFTGSNGSFIGFNSSKTSNIKLKNL